MSRSALQVYLVYFVGCDVNLRYNSASSGAAAFATGDHPTQSGSPSYPHTHTMFLTTLPSKFPLPPAAHEVPGSDETYFMYCFECARNWREQFVFAGNSLANGTLYLIRSLGVEPQASNPDDSAAKYHESAHWQLGNARHLQYPDTEAIAATLLVQYSLLTGGRRNRHGKLEDPREAKPQAYLDEHDARPASEAEEDHASLSGRPRASWRFLALYQRLSGSSFWANSPQTGVRMDLLTGSPDEVALATGEISALASWKNAGLVRRGGLSVRELVRNAASRFAMVDDNILPVQKTGISTIDEPQDIKYLQGALAKTKQQLLDSELNNEGWKLQVDNDRREIKKLEELERWKAEARHSQDAVTGLGMDITVLRGQHEEQDSIVASLHADIDRLESEIRSHAETMARLKVRISQVDEATTCPVCLERLWTPWLCVRSVLLAVFSSIELTSQAAYLVGTYAVGYDHRHLDALRAILNARPALEAHSAARTTAYAEIGVIEGTLPHPRFTCPECRAVVGTKPIEAYSLKEVAALVAEIQGDDRPESPSVSVSAAGSISQPSTSRNAFDEFFPCLNPYASDEP
ncbi:uncharacterized protein B0H18DRAFT_956005 [Fomitopsis serialis]|uniref:uncharacterized protein n=1 Tax=Fomitopsis serialis TaxID=139415 RepID=UPI00200806BA|nr:uncharacterized protein B0H18DRAFT_956005 [Neoantrodia serialis]KAH9923083.1 hypothetical protein B0H18DRAFT_956005 [Neoantrodia serialis]